MRAHLDKNSIFEHNILAIAITPDYVLLVLD